MSSPFVHAVCQEVFKALRARNSSDNTDPTTVSDTFAGKVTLATSFVHDPSVKNMIWIVDTGTSDHITF